MSVSLCLRSYLRHSNIDYQVIHHTFTETAYDSALSAKLPCSSVIKAITLRDTNSNNYLIAVIPATNRLKLTRVCSFLKRELILADEGELVDLFPDCFIGAVPALGQAYELEVIWGSALLNQRNLYLEAGDHEDLIELNQQQFRQLFENLPHAIISQPVGNFFLH